MAELVQICQALKQVKDFSPLQRILLTCSGTLQGTLSAYFGQEVTVQLLQQEEKGWPVIERLVELKTGAQVVCAAATQISVTEPTIRREILSGRLGIGQVLETLGVRPSFSLMQAGQNREEFWRVYRLEAPGVAYQITETFPQSLYR